MKEITKRSNCPVSFCLDFIGDKWSLLIIRDMILDGKTTFGEFLDSPEHIATNILTTRLKMLEAERIIGKYSIPGKIRTGYCLMPKGIDLIPLITEMSLWGANHSNNIGKEAFLAAIRKDKNAVNKELTDKLIRRYEDIQDKVIA